MMKRRRFTWALIIGLSLFFVAVSGVCRAADDTDFGDGQKPAHRLAAVSYVSWWSHDHTGYHPSILLKLENYSGRDLTGVPIKFQARFVDLTHGIVTIARRELRQSMVPHQQTYLLLRGPLPFELPIDDNNWPLIECKVMARVGEVDDQGTQTLIVTRLESITMNDDDAMQKMARQPDFSRTPTRSQASSKTAAGGSKPTKPSKPEKPLVATAGKLPVKSDSENKTAAQAQTSTASYVSGRDMPGLGEDFYEFEQAFGMPTETNASDRGWTWAAYKQTRPGLTVTAGSKGNTGKADIIIIEVAAADLAKDNDLVAITRAFSGTFKSQRISPPARSVRYLPAGRMQLVTLTAQGYSTAHFRSPARGDGSTSAFLVLSRVPGNIVDLIHEHAKNAVLIQPVAHILSGG